MQSPVEALATLDKTRETAKRIEAAQTARRKMNQTRKAMSLALNDSNTTPTAPAPSRVANVGHRTSLHVKMDWRQHWTETLKFCSNCYGISHRETHQLPCHDSIVVGDHQDRAGNVDNKDISSGTARKKLRETTSGRRQGSTVGRKTSRPSHQVCSTALQQSVFVRGKINRVPSTILVDTGAAVTIVHRRVWDRGRRTATLEDNTSSVSCDRKWRTSQASR